MKIKNNFAKVAVGASLLASGWTAMIAGLEAEDATAPFNF
jgi:hypothetical protein